MRRCGGDRGLVGGRDGVGLNPWNRLIRPWDLFGGAIVSMLLMSLIGGDIAVINSSSDTLDKKMYQIEVEVGSSVVIKRKVSDYVRSLNIIRI